MELRFFNTLTRKKEVFKPIKKGRVGLYTCGPTVYNYPHIGNYRAYIFEDVLRRVLEYAGYKVTQVMNLTDVDDKTIRGAKEAGVSLKAFTEKYTTAFFEDLETLNIEKAEHYPKATEHIEEMVGIIKKLLGKGYAYKTAEGDIYYEIAKFGEYGKLSHFKLKKLETGKSGRVKADEYGKDNVRDFALWKAWDEEDGDVFWETEFGRGRPGWHIECSGMSTKYLGETFDMHTGGIDNMFPHHENEIAQSEAASGKKFVNYWMHCDHLIVDGKKMSKSLGNFYTLRDLTEKGNGPKAIRYMLINAHYRQQLNFTIAGIGAAKKSVERLNEFVQRAGEADGGENKEIKKLVEKHKTGFEKFIFDDLNVPPALAVVFDFVREVNKLIDEGKAGKKNAKEILEFMKKVDSILGVMSFETRKKADVGRDIEALIEERELHRKNKDWAKADGIRDRLLEKGIALSDTPGGVKWRKV